MANYSNLLESQRAMEAAFTSRMAKFEAQLKNTEPQTASSLTRLSEEFHNFKTEMCGMMNMLRQLISKLSVAVDGIEMRHRRKYLLLGGISEDIEDNQLPGSVVMILKEKLGLTELKVEDFTVCHRLGTASTEKPRMTLLRFRDETFRSMVWQKKTALKGTPHTLSEFLTRHRQSLFQQARKRFGVKRCWTMNGNIIVKLRDGSRCRVAAAEDLDGIALVENEECPAVTAVYQSAEARVSSPAASSELHSKTKRTTRAKK